MSNNEESKNILNKVVSLDDYNKEIERLNGIIQYQNGIIEDLTHKMNHWYNECYKMVSYIHNYNNSLITNNTTLSTNNYNQIKYDFDYYEKMRIELSKDIKRDNDKIIEMKDKIISDKEEEIQRLNNYVKELIEEKKKIEKDKDKLIDKLLLGVDNK